MGTFCKKSPCKDCPYRTDAPVALWSVEEFKDLIANDESYFGASYGCHKKDGLVCTGFAMDQVRRDFPSIKFRMVLSAKKVTREFLDSLSSPVPLFDSIYDMAAANFPNDF